MRYMFFFLQSECLGCEHETISIVESRVELPILFRSRVWCWNLLVLEVFQVIIRFAYPFHSLECRIDEGA